MGAVFGGLLVIGVDPLSPSLATFRRKIRFLGKESWEDRSG
jgi:hypothetical protein